MEYFILLIIAIIYYLYIKDKRKIDDKFTEVHEVQNNVINQIYNNYNVNTLMHELKVTEEIAQKLVDTYEEIQDYYGDNITLQELIEIMNSSNEALNKLLSMTKGISRN